MNPPYKGSRAYTVQRHREGPGGTGQGIRTTGHITQPSNRQTSRTRTEPRTERDHQRRRRPQTQRPAHSTTPSPRAATTAAGTVAAAAGSVGAHTQLNAVRLGTARSTQIRGLGACDNAGALTPDTRPGTSRDTPLYADGAECSALHALGRPQCKPRLSARTHELALRPAERALPRRTRPSGIEQERRHRLEDLATKVTGRKAHVHRIDPAKAILAEAIVVPESDPRQQIVV